MKKFYFQFINPRTERLTSFSRGFAESYYEENPIEDEETIHAPTLAEAIDRLTDRFQDATIRAVSVARGAWHKLNL